MSGYSNNEKFLIIAGGGKFGKKALDFAKKNQYKTILIDIDPNCFASEYSNKKFENLENLSLEMKNIKPGDIYFLNQDISTIYELISKINPEYVVPVVPIHLLFLIINSFLSSNNIKMIPNENLMKFFINNANSELILDHIVEKGVVYLSYAKKEEICPDNCSGPPDYCPNFKRDKPITITKYINNFYRVENNFKIQNNKISSFIIILESYQLVSGLGALKGTEIDRVLKELMKKLDILLNKKFNLIIATTCNCHGVVNFYKNYQK